LIVTLTDLFPLHHKLHFPFPYLGGADALCQGLAESVDLGLIKSVGVSNFEAAELTYFHNALVRKFKNIIQYRSPSRPPCITRKAARARSREREIACVCSC
jgi:aryl-alcohol dehydrogenase-like predicted oxidoreductase